MFIPDKTKKTVRLFVRIKDNSVVRFDGTPLPKLQDDTFADLILPASSLTEKAERQELERESGVELLPAGTCLFVGLSPSTMKRKPRGLLGPTQLQVGHGYFFAEVRLREPLGLRLRGAKEPCLEVCKCDIPVLNTNARSLNHAFTLLSTRFETDRISHTGQGARLSDDSEIWKQLFSKRRGFRPYLPCNRRLPPASTCDGLP